MSETRPDEPGKFYLGREHDLVADARGEDVMYSSRDLTTHAVCVGMTGSGKTGLCVGLLEEAGLDGIPALVIDPKGDIPNLLLTFPELRPEDFEPWVDHGEADRKGLSVEDFAANRAELWKNGLADWGVDGERIRRFRDKVDLTIYTPGSSAGVGLSPLRSFEAPDEAIRNDAEAMSDRVSSSVSALLSMLRIDSDPLTGREHILLSSIVERAWSAGESLDLAALIGRVQSPGFDKVGVVDLETFMPTKARTDLAMRLNSVLASPGFRQWLEGEPLDIQSLLYTSEGKPRISIVSIAHLSESERMFVVTLLLSELVAWVRSQPGTTSLRALLYMDEVFGYFPPVANPPSKRPLLTLMKQARAHGLGVVLATQNPVDLDYKGLSNAGTWFLGRLQTERDKARVMEGLEGAGGGFDRDETDRLLAGLKSRVFLMHSVHEKRPSVFHTRWVMSYLRGPVTREHIRTLMAGKKEAPSAAPKETSTPAPTSNVTARAPAPPGGVASRFLETDGGGETFRAALLGVAPLHFVRVAAGIDVWEDARLVAPIDTDGGVWRDAHTLDAETELTEEAPPDSAFGELPAPARDAKRFAAWRKSLIAHAYRHSSRELWHCKALKTYSELGESEEAFRDRLATIAEDDRQADEKKVIDRFANRLAVARDRLRKAEEKVDKEKAQFRQSGLQAFFSVIAAIVGALLGKKKVSATSVRSAGTAASRAGRTAKEKGDISRAEAGVIAAQERLEMLEQQQQDAIDRLADEAADLELTRIVVRPRKGDLSTAKVMLLWER